MKRKTTQHKVNEKINNLSYVVKGKKKNRRNV